MAQARHRPAPTARHGPRDKIEQRLRARHDRASQQCAPTFWAQPKTLQSFNAILNLIVQLCMLCSILAAFHPKAGLKDFQSLR